MQRAAVVPILSTRYRSCIIFAYRVDAILRRSLHPLHLHYRRIVYNIETFMAPFASLLWSLFVSFGHTAHLRPSWIIIVPPFEPWTISVPSALLLHCRCVVYNLSSSICLIVAILRHPRHIIVVCVVWAHSTLEPFLNYPHVAFRTMNHFSTVCNYCCIVVASFAIFPRLFASLLRSWVAILKRPRHIFLLSVSFGHTVHLRLSWIIIVSSWSAHCIFLETFVAVWYGLATFVAVWYGMCPAFAGARIGLSRGRLYIHLSELTAPGLIKESKDAVCQGKDVSRCLRYLCIVSHGQ